MHISTFNAKSFPIPFEWKNKVDYWIDKMGYHFQIAEVIFPDSPVIGKIYEVRLRIENRGVAPIYNSIPLMLKLKNNSAEYVFDTKVDICDWMPGQTDSIFNFELPLDVKPDDYLLEIGIVGKGLPTARFCTDTEEDGDYLILGKIKVVKELIPVNYKS